MVATKGEEEPTGEAYWLSVIARALALVCLRNADLQKADNPAKADFLNGLGLGRRDIASILRTTEDAVRKSLERSKNSGRSRHGKAKPKGR